MSWRDWFRRKPEPKRRAVARRSVFAGAQQGRLFDDWVASWMSATDETRWELRLLRNRSRESSRNNPIARRYLGLVDENVLGPKGLQLQARNMMASGEPDEETNQQIETAWAAWGDRQTCTADGKLCWREFVGAALDAVARDGEALVEMIPGFPNAYGFAVRLLDVDLLDEDFNRPAKDSLTGNRIIQSVEIDQWGREVAFHVWTQHPTETITLSERKRERKEARYLLHLGRPRRVGQVRYEPWLTPVLAPLRMLNEYLNAELVAARMAAENVGFIQKSENAPGSDPEDPAAGQRLLETAKGTLQELGLGESFQSWDSNHPNAVLPQFVREMKAEIAQGLNVAYASLTGDMSQSNYSSSRLALTNERDQWRILQAWLGAALCTPVYRVWLRQAAIWQQVRLPGPATAFLDHEWEPRGFEYVDPEKDIKADLLEVDAGLNSLTRVCAGRGRDLRTILLERKAELTLAEQLGVPLNVAAKPAAPPAPDATEPKDTEEPADA